MSFRKMLHNKDLKTELVIHQNQFIREKILILNELKFSAGKGIIFDLTCLCSFKVRYLRFKVYIDQMITFLKNSLSSFPSNGNLNPYICIEI